MGKTRQEAIDRQTYIVNLTNNIIGKLQLDQMIRQFNYQRPEFIEHATIVIEHATDVSKMKPETLGIVMCSLSGLVPAKNPFAQIGFAGDTEESFRELVALCLAYVIHDRLTWNPSHLLPAYRKSDEKSFAS